MKQDQPRAGRASRGTLAVESSPFDSSQQSRLARLVIIGVETLGSTPPGKELTFTIGSGKARISAQTFSGSITLRTK